MKLTFVLIGISSLFAAAPAPVVSVKVLGHQPGLKFVRFADPKENAFSAEVPQGWRSKGGLYRFASVDTRGALEITAPEGNARVSWGDAGLPPFTVPTRLLAMAGFRDGSWYSPGYGVRMLVRRYEPGAVFAEDYVRSMVARRLGCESLSIASRASRDDLTEALNGLYAQFGAMGTNVREDAGEVRFTCMRDGQPWTGYYLAVTLFTSNSGGAMWHVEDVVGFAASESGLPAAQAATLRLMQTMQLNPAWVQMQAGITAATSQIVAQTNEKISSIIHDTFQNQQRTYDEVFRHDTNVRRGVTDVMDPDSGDSWKVQNDANYYWHKPGSNVIKGTNTYDSPGPGYEPLQEY